MKNLLIVLIIVIVVGAAGYAGYKYLGHTTPTPASTDATSQTSTVTGTLLPGKGDDYSYILMAGGGRSIGIASQKIDLSLYANKKVEITGSYSGTTLYAYTVTEIK